MVAEVKQIIRKFGIEYFGIYPNTYFGRVIDNNDPKKRGRLKVIVPDIYGDQVVFAMPYSDSSTGQIDFHLPDIDDEVAVRFISGNILYPIWSSKFTESKEINPKLNELNLATTSAKYRKNIGYQLNEADDSFLLENSQVFVELIGGLLKLNGGDFSSVKGETLNDKLTELINIEKATLDLATKNTNAIIQLISILTGILPPLSAQTTQLIANLTAELVPANANKVKLDNLGSSLDVILSNTVKLK